MNIINLISKMFTYQRLTLVSCFNVFDDYNDFYNFLHCIDNFWVIHVAYHQNIRTQLLRKTHNEKVLSDTIVLLKLKHCVKATSSGEQRLLLQNRDFQILREKLNESCTITIYIYVLTQKAHVSFTYFHAIQVFFLYLRNKLMMRNINDMTINQQVAGVYRCFRNQ